MTKPESTQMRLLRDIETLLECKMCHERITPPVVMCHKGHCICKKCNTPGCMCPICNKFLITNQFVMLENLLNILPRHCKYTKYGCKEIIRGVYEHEKYCLERPTTCELGKDTPCTWSGSFRDWLDHASGYSHAEVTFENGADSLILVQYHGFQSEWVHYNNLIQLEKSYFLLQSIKCDKKHLHISSQYLGQNARFSSPIPNYHMKVTFLKGGIKHFSVGVNTNDNKSEWCMVPLNELKSLVTRFQELDMFIELQVQDKA